MSQNLICLDWQQDVGCLISSLDILLLLPLKHEGFPRSLAEGMACEIPVIGTSIGGINEIIDDKKNGLLVPPSDEKSVAEAICCLLSNHQLAQQLAKNGRKKIVSKFTIARHVEEIERIYKEFL